MNNSQVDLFIQEEWDSLAFRYTDLAALSMKKKDSLKAYLKNPTGLFFYDTLLTCSQEVKHIWARKRRMGAIIYVIARYSVLFSLLLSILGFFLPVVANSLQACNTLVVIVNLTEIITWVGIHGLLLARVYAICGNRRWIAGIPFLFFLGRIITMLAMIPLDNCTSSIRNITLIDDIAGAFTLLLDTTVFIIVTTHTWGVYRFQLTMMRSTSGSLFGLFLKQGVIRFGIIMIWITEEIVTVRTLRLSIAGVDTGLELAISAILVCRFHLELLDRHCNLERGTDGLSLGHSSLTSYRAVVRHIGQSIDNEFGDIPMNHSSDNERPQLAADVTSAVISAEEFPWIGGVVEDIEANPTNNTTS